MPEHLEKHTLDEPAQELLEELGKWLASKGTYVQGIKTFEKCISEGLEQEVRELWRKMTLLLGQIQGTSEVSITHAIVETTNHIPRLHSTGVYQGHNLEVAG
jgi:hypothetical protein